MKFEGFKKNTIVEWPSKPSIDLSSEERKSVLDQKERLEKEGLMKEIRESVSSNSGKFRFRNIDEVDFNNSQIKEITNACVNLTINMIKSYFPKTDDITDIEYEEFIQALADVYYEEKTLEYLNGGSSNEYREIK